VRVQGGEPATPFARLLHRGSPLFLSRRFAAMPAAFPDVAMKTLLQS
jgi:hypothetical protein